MKPIADVCNAALLIVFKRSAMKKRKRINEIEKL
jgi:hypothetical protein